MKVLKISVLIILALLGFLIFADKSYAASCTISVANWSASNTSVGSSVNLVAGGNSNCMGKSVELRIFKTATIDLVGTINTIFDTPGTSVAATALGKWTVTDTNANGFYFVAKCSDDSCGTKTSGVLSVPNCNIVSANWSTQTAANGSNVNLIIGGNGCLGRKTLLNIFQRDSRGNASAIAVLNPIFNAPGVSAGSTALTQWTVDTSKSGNLFYFIAKCANIDCGTGISTNLGVSSSGGGSPSGNVKFRIDNFDVIQKSIPSGSSSVNFIFKLTQLDKSYSCNYLLPGKGSVEWVVWYVTPSGKSTVVRRKSVPLPLPNDQFNLDFTEANFIPSTGFISEKQADFRTAVDCSVVASAGASNMALSAPVKVTSGTIGGTSGGSKYTCNRQNQCVADPNGEFGDAKCGTGCSSSASGGKGASQSFKFEITNPLAGGANTLFDLVNVVITWIFNISIPIAVIFILWAGFLMLTAGANPPNWAKGKEVLKYVLIGLAVIFVGKGFVTLIISIIQLGGTGQTTQQGPGVPGPGQPPFGGFPPGTTLYGCTDRGYCVEVQDPNNIPSSYREVSDDASCSNACSPTGPTGDVGSFCKKKEDCQQTAGFKCSDSICQRANGNFINEPCNSGRNCASGETCDKSQVIISDGRRLGTCVAK